MAGKRLVAVVPTARARNPWWGRSKGSTKRISLRTVTFTGPERYPLAKAASPAAAAAVARGILSRLDRDREHVVTLALNCRHRVTGFKVSYSGDGNGSVCEPRTLLRDALALDAAGIIIVHNHPSGDPKPSEADVRTSQRVARAGQDVGIPLRDSIVLGANCAYVSLLSKGLLSAARLAMSEKAPARPRRRSRIETAIPIGPEHGPLTREEALRAARHAFDVVLAEGDESTSIGARVQENVKSIGHFADAITGAIDPDQHFRCEAGDGEIPIPSTRLELRDCARAIATLCPQVRDNLGIYFIGKASLEVLEMAILTLLPELAVEIPWKRLPNETRRAQHEASVRHLQLEGWTFENAPAAGARPEGGIE